jgi:hypothetical protein
VLEAACLPGLKSSFDDELTCVTRHVNKLTSLQPLGICMYTNCLHTGPPQPLEQVCLKLPEVAKAGQRGVKLVAYAAKGDLLGVLRNMHTLRSTWAKHA